MDSVADALRRVMRSFPAGVAIATVDLEGERLGLTLGSLVSLSLDPPLVGISVSRNAALHELLRRAGAFGLSLLVEGQEALAQHFARGVPPIALWAGIITHGGDGRPPLLEGALGWIECRVWAEYPVGDHTFFVGEVTGAESGRAGAPLLRLGGEFRPA